MQVRPPHPSILREYDDVVPGSAERIIAKFEKQADHRMALEKATIHSDIRRSWAGLAAGLIVALTVICFGFIAIMHGHEISGSILSTGGLSGLVGTFIYGTQSKRTERLERAKLMTGKK